MSLIEVACDPDMTRGGKATWHAKMTVDLAWVASCKPFADEACSIALAGSGQFFIINIGYSQFMQLWQAARKHR